MSGTTRNDSRRLEAARDALDSGRWFEAERETASLLGEARRRADFEAMASVIPTLRDARQARFEEAFRLGEGSIMLLEEELEEEPRIDPGCWLVQPPLVGADAKKLRWAGLEQEVPVAVLCREPLTQLGLQPVVCIDQTTIRVKVDPPTEIEHPDLEWFRYALDELGEHAIETVDTGVDLEKQVDSLLDRVMTLPEHARLHDALEETCRMAANPPGGGR